MEDEKFVAKVCKALMLMTGLALVVSPEVVFEINEEIFEPVDLDKIMEYADKYDESESEEEDGKLQVEW